MDGLGQLMVGNGVIRRSVMLAMLLAWVLGACGGDDSASGESDNGNPGGSVEVDALFQGSGTVSVTVDGVSETFEKVSCRDVGGMVNLPVLDGDGFGVVITSTQLDGPVRVQVLRDPNLYSGDKVPMDGDSLVAEMTLANANDGQDTIEVSVDMQC